MQQNNKKSCQHQKQEFLFETKIEHLREELKEEFKKLCQDLQINIKNITKQQGLLQNLVLDIVNQREHPMELEIESNNKYFVRFLVQIKIYF